MSSFYAFVFRAQSNRFEICVVLIESVEFSRYAGRYGNGGNWPRRIKIQENINRTGADIVWPTAGNFRLIFPQSQRAKSVFNYTRFPNVRVIFGSWYYFVLSVSFVIIKYLGRKILYNKTIHSRGSLINVSLQTVV